MIVTQTKKEIIIDLIVISGLFAGLIVSEVWFLHMLDITGKMPPILFNFVVALIANSIPLWQILSDLDKLDILKNGYRL